MLMQNKRQFYKLGAPTVPQQPSHTSGRLVPHTSPSGVKIWFVVFLFPRDCTTFSRNMCFCCYAFLAEKNTCYFSMFFRTQVPKIASHRNLQVFFWYTPECHPWEEIIIRALRDYLPLLSLNYTWKGLGALFPEGGGYTLRFCMRGWTKWAKCLWKYPSVLILDKWFRCKLLMGSLARVSHP